MISGEVLEGKLRKKGKVMIKYKFTCEYTKIYQRRFEEVVEYDHKPDDDELEADYNAWLSDYIVGGYQCLDEGQ